MVTCTLRQILQASEDEKKAEAPAARRWCIAVDGSHAAHNAFLTCLRLASPKDFIQVIYASDDARKGTSTGRPSLPVLLSRIAPHNGSRVPWLCGCRSCCSRSGVTVRLGWRLVVQITCRKI